MGGVSAKIYRIKLSAEERAKLISIRDRGSNKAVKFKRVAALLLCDEGPFGPALTDAEVQRGTSMSPRTLVRLRQRCCEVGPLGALERKTRETPPREIKVTGEVEARITQLACSDPPEGHSRWTLRLLAKHLVEIEVIDSISHNTVGLVLKKVSSNPGVKKAGAFPQNSPPPS
jgi:hypothetical protein